jgi:hypothetical protein
MAVKANHGKLGIGKISPVKAVKADHQRTIGWGLRGPKTSPSQPVGTSKMA